MKTGFRVLDGMTTKPIVAAETTSLQEVARLMDKYDIGSVLISRESRIRGIVTEEDIVRKAVMKLLDVKKTPVSRIMETKLITITPEKDIFDALVVMRDNDVKHLPVVDGKTKKLLGLITINDILKIEPQLFDIIVENIELREERRKPVYERIRTEGVCQSCGELSSEIMDRDGTLMCPECRS